MQQHVLSPESHAAYRKYERPSDDDAASALSQLPGPGKEDQRMNRDINEVTSVDRKRKLVERR
jgi:hypothetical protein